jgi:SAM-dependent methyltransferase
MRRLMITVGVDADPRRAGDGDAIDRLIWGRHAGGQAGLAEMMSSAKSQNARLVMLLDWCAEETLGAGLADVAREIHVEGHDLQVQARDELLTPGFWAAVRRNHPEDARLSEDARTEAVVGLGITRHRELTGATPRAYRAGSFRYTPGLLRSLAKHGVLADSSCNPARPDHTLHGRCPLRPFRWDTGGLEMTVGCVDGYLNLDRVVDLNFDVAALNTADRLMVALDRFYEQQTDHALAVMTMHSWSFSPRESDGTLGAPSSALADRFGAFLDLLGEHDVEIVSTEDVMKLDADRALGIEVTVPLSDLTVLVDTGPPQKDAETGAAARPGRRPTPGAPRDSSLGPIAPSDELVSACPVCGLGGESFDDFNGRPKSRCPSCGSLERQRVFARVYESFLCDEFDLRGKHAMAVCPSGAERQLFTRYGLEDVVCVDVRPEVKPDALVDICGMPEIARHTYDCVIASYVLTCVYDLHAALMEIHRVLKPGGYFIFSEPLVFGGPTVEYDDMQAITAWYGDDAYARYRVGSFRKLGDLDILERLSGGFLTKTFYGLDPITKTKVVWHAARRRAHPSASRL